MKATWQRRQQDSATSDEDEVAKHTQELQRVQQDLGRSIVRKPKEGCEGDLSVFSAVFKF